MNVMRTTKMRALKMSRKYYYAPHMEHSLRLNLCVFFRIIAAVALNLSPSVFSIRIGKGSSKSNVLEKWVFIRFVLILLVGFFGWCLCVCLCILSMCFLVGVEFFISFVFLFNAFRVRWNDSNKTRQIQTIKNPKQTNRECIKCF